MSAKDDTIFIDLMERSIEASGPIWYVLRKDYSRLCSLAGTWAVHEYGNPHRSDPFGPRAISLSDARKLIELARTYVVNEFTAFIES